MNAPRIRGARHLCLLVAVIGVVLAVPATAQESAQEEGMSSMPGMDMPGMQMPGMQMPGKRKPVPPTKQEPKQQARKPALSAMQGMPAHSPQATAMQHLHFGHMIGTRPKTEGLASGGMQGMHSMSSMSVSSMQGGSAPPDARSGDYSDGYRYGAMRGMDMADNESFGMVLLDQLEYAHSSHGNNVFLDGQAWYGTDFNKVWVTAEGESAQGRLRDLRTEGLWDHVIATYWSTQVGVRHDSGVGPDRTWAALGVQGLAPYWFDTEATIYVGQGGRTAARLQLEYEELLTQRWVLQPKVELNLYGRDDPQRGNGSGLSDAEFGLRLRYEIRREIAPYVGIVYRQRFGHAADFARAQGDEPDDLQIVVGLHAWL
jgi:copper resistance protein B